MKLQLFIICWLSDAGGVVAGVHYGDRGGLSVLFHRSPHSPEYNQTHRVFGGVGQTKELEVES